MTKYLALIAQFHWTIDNLILALLGVFIVEGLRAIGRSSAPTTQRTKFNLGVWFSQTKNWMSPLVSWACTLVVLAIGATQSTFLADNANEFAFVAGACGQSIIKVFVNAVNGAVGKYGRATDKDQV